jgi:predicted acyltransferase
MSQSPEAAPSADRLHTLDALRGFDLFWIVGGREALLALIALAAVTLPVGWVEWLEDAINWTMLRGQMNHIGWVGFSAWDLIMPLFLFVVGAAMPFSIGKRLEEGKSRFSQYLRVFRRVLLLWILGAIAQGNLLRVETWIPQLLDESFKDNYNLHVFSNTLQAIAVGYLFAAIAVMHLPKLAQGILVGVLLVGYWALMQFVPFSDAAGATFMGVIEPKCNVAWAIDNCLLGRFGDGTDYTWILSGIGFTVTTLLGVFAGDLLRAKRSNLSKLLWLVILGLGAIALGLLWCGHFSIGKWAADLPDGWWLCPMNKHVWSSSMVLYAGGWSFLLLALFYLLIDVWGLKRLGFFFTVIGANAILVYMMTRDVGNLWQQINANYVPVPNKLIPFDVIANNLIGGIVQLYSGGGGVAAKLASVWVPLVSFGILWAVLYHLYRKQTFLRV